MNRDEQNDFKMEGRSYFLSFFLTENLSATTVAAIAKEFMTSLQTQPPNLTNFQTTLGLMMQKGPFPVRSFL